MSRKKEVSAADDLSPIDRAWAELISDLVKCSIGDAEKRVRRMRYDPRIAAKIVEVQAQLDPNTVITDVEWTGPERKDLTIRVTAMPVRRGVRGGGFVYDPVNTRRAMIDSITRFELRTVFGRWHTALPEMVSMGTLRL